MILIKNLSRRFGDIKAVNDISFEIQPGEIVGFLGPNGAGKTTTMRMMVGYLQPSGGSIEINGEDINKDPIKTSQIIGYLPENNPLYYDMTVYKFLAYVGALRKLKGAEFRRRMEYVVQNCGLKEVLHQKIGTLSKGYKQRTGLAQAILHDPQVLIMDEPTSGLDPNQILEIRDLIRELGREKTLILSSHIMQEVQALCDRIIIISEGKIVANDTQDHLVQNFSSRQEIRLSFEAEEPDLESICTEIPDLELLGSSSEGILHQLVLQSQADFDARRALARLCGSRGWLILEITSHKSNLEDIFYGLTKGGDSALETELNEIEEHQDIEETDIDEANRGEVEGADSPRHHPEQSVSEEEPNHER